MKTRPYGLGRLLITIALLLSCRPAVPPPIPPTVTPNVIAPVTAATPPAVPLTPRPLSPAKGWRGVDISYLPQVEAAGAQFTAGGVPQDALTLLARHGINSVRLRVWVNPPDGHHDTPTTLALARRIHAAGMGLLLNLHYSDTWADPGHQSKPAAWADFDFPALQTAVYDYTAGLITALKAQDTLPHIVQIGNEISPGMLWEDGRVGGGHDNNWPQLAALLQAGIAGVKDSLAPTDDVQIMIHLNTGGDNAACRWFLDNLQTQGVAFDVLGLTYYPWWQGGLPGLTANLHDLSQRYPQDIIIVETAYPWTLAWQDETHNLVGQESQLLPGYPATPTGQAAFLRAVLTIVQALPHGKGVGIYYWQPEYVARPTFGSSWENVTLFDARGEALPALAVLGGQPASNDVHNQPVALRLARIAADGAITYLRGDAYAYSQVWVAPDGSGAVVPVSNAPGAHRVLWLSADGSPALELPIPADYNVAFPTIQWGQ